MDKELSVISLDKIKEAVKLGKTINAKSYKVEYDDHLDCGVEASFVTIRKRRNCNLRVAKSKRRHAEWQKTQECKI